MKKKSIILAAVAFTAIIGGWSAYENMNHTTDYQFKELCKISADATSKMRIVDGTTGKTTVVDNQETIDTLVKDFGTITYENITKKPAASYEYAVTLLAGDEEIVKMTLKNDKVCQIDGRDYEVPSTMAQWLRELSES